jgi:hypothetical protein
LIITTITLCYFPLWNQKGEGEEDACGIKPTAGNLIAVTAPWHKDREEQGFFFFPWTHFGRHPAYCIIRKGMHPGHSHHRPQTAAYKCEELGET